MNKEKSNVHFQIGTYLKIICGLLLLSVFVIAVSFLTLDKAMASELETETEQETIYQDGTFAILEDGTIVDLSAPQSDGLVPLEEVETTQGESLNESETDVSGTGDSQQNDVLSETDQVDGEGSLPGESVSESTQNTEVSDSTVYISNSNVYIQPLPDDNDANSVAYYGTADIVSLPSDRCVSYEVTINGTAFTAVFPLSAADSLAVLDGILCNVGSSAVTGRLFQDSFDTGAYGEYYCTLNSVLSTAGNTNAYRYGAWSYVTYYEPYSGTSQTNLSGSNTYCNIYVTESPSAFSEYTQFQILLVALLLVDIVVTIIDTVRKEKRY